MTPELIAIIVMGVVLAGIVLVWHRATVRAFRADARDSREDTDRQP